MKNQVNIAAVSASPHSDGITSKMLTQCLDFFPEASVKLYPLYSLLPQPCTDCGFCKKQEGCSKHDLDDFMSAYEQADIVIFASPVYNLSFPAPFKALLDRFQRYFNARFSLGKKPPIAKPKRALLLASCGSHDERGFSVMCSQLEMCFTVLNTTLVSSVFCAGTDNPETFVFPAEEIERAVKALQ